ncbi:MAG: sugar phosphate isomerase/epimerase [Candidatus Dadabacteria bacterium]|nr:sugar phosphate isomerase/epimerase [Candidatus Dadabacteria bacterium]
MKIKDDVHVALPWHMMEQYFDVAYSTGLNLEFGLSSGILDNVQPKEFERIGDLMKSKGLSCTLHAPFLDLSSGALDLKILEVTRFRYQQTMDAAEILRPSCVVFHTGFSSHHYLTYSEYWLRESLETWKEVLDSAEKLELQVAIENVFDTDPSTLKRIISSIPHPLLGVCLDAGHINVFSEVAIEEWFNELGDKVFETHLHDNNGKYDEHIGIGMGNFDFQTFFKLLWSNGTKPVLTIEGSTQEAVQESIGYLMSLETE